MALRKYHRSLFFDEGYQRSTCNIVFLVAMATKSFCLSVSLSLFQAVFQPLHMQLASCWLDHLSNDSTFSIESQSPSRAFHSPSASLASLQICSSDVRIQVLRASPSLTRDKGLLEVVFLMISSLQDELRIQFYICLNLITRAHNPHFQQQDIFKHSELLLFEGLTYVFIKTYF